MTVISGFAYSAANRAGHSISQSGTDSRLLSKPARTFRCTKKYGSASEYRREWQVRLQVRDNSGPSVRPRSTDRIRSASKTAVERLNWKLLTANGRTYALGGPLGGRISLYFRQSRRSRVGQAAWIEHLPFKWLPLLFSFHSLPYFP